MLNEHKIWFDSRGSFSKWLLCILVKIYAVMSPEFTNILNVSCLSGDLEGKVKWLDNFQKFRHLQEIIVWPPLWDRDKRFFIPEVQKGSIKTMSLSRSLAFRWKYTNLSKSPAVCLEEKKNLVLWAKSKAFFHVAWYMGRLTSPRHSLGGLSERFTHTSPFPSPPTGVSKCLDLDRQSALPQLLKHVLCQSLTTALWFFSLVLQVPETCF